MIYLPEKDYDLPNVDLLTLLFDSRLSLSDESTVLHAEAADPSNAITKSQTRQLTRRIAHILRHHFDIGKHAPGKDIVVCVSEGQVLLPTVFYGVVAAGGVFSAASNSFTVGELARQIKSGHARMVITGSGCQETALKAAAESGIPPSRVLVLESMGHKRILRNAATGRNYLAHSESTEELDWDRITDPETLRKSVACLLYSSGTTGVPKGVKVSHLNHVAEALIPQFMHREWVRGKQREDLAFKFEYRTLAHLPAAHVAGCQGYFVNPPVAGGTTYWMEKFDFPRFLEYNKQLKITMLFTVPPIYLLISKSSAVTDQFQTMVHAVSGAAPMGPALQSAAQKRLGCNISQTWGLSETTGSVTILPWHASDLTGSVSPLMPNMRLRIVDDAGNDVEGGLEGEFLMKGPVVTTGYFENRAADREAFTADGWFKTGDIGLIRNRLLYISDRKKELIKYKGLQVAPAELEALLIAHDRIADAAVIGVPAADGSGNEVPRAYVVADKSMISEEEIKQYVKSNLASHKQLRGGVVYISAIPKSPSGKILRRELRELVKKESQTAKL